jgi:hypothetical protein
MPLPRTKKYRRPRNTSSVAYFGRYNVPESGVETMMFFKKYNVGINIRGERKRFKNCIISNFPCLIFFFEK